MTVLKRLQIQPADVVQVIDELQILGSSERSRTPSGRQRR